MPTFQTLSSHSNLSSNAQELTKSNCIDNLLSETQSISDYCDLNWVSIEKPPLILCGTTKTFFPNNCSSTATPTGCARQTSNGTQPEFHRKLKEVNWFKAIALIVEKTVISMKEFGARKDRKSTRL